jgi:hypothetical protein
MEIPGLEGIEREDALRMLAFYEIARRANLLNHPDLVKSPIFQTAKKFMTRGRRTFWKDLASRKPLPSQVFP